jgi:tRNA (cytosine38-C5)-methyltransferase
MSNDSDEIGNTNRKRDREGKFLVATRFDLEAPEARTFDADWSNDIDWKNDMRYFSGTEIARLMGFPVSKPAVRSRAAHDGIDTAFRKFSFPSTISVKQQWKLLGNSLNVQVAGTLAEIGIKTLLCSDLLKN